MRLRRSLAISLKAVLARKLRTALALASVSVGVAAVIVTGALGAGAREEVMRRLDTLGTNLLVVRPAQVRVFAARKTVRGVVTTLKPEDCDAIARLPGVALVAPGVEDRARVKAGSQTTIASVLGTTAAFRVIRSFSLAEGRFFDAEEARGAQRVAVLGARVAFVLFATTSPIGHSVSVRGVPFDVVGVLAPRGVAVDGSDQDGQVIIPVRTALRRLLNVTWLNEVFVRVQDADDMDATGAQIAELLRERHRTIGAEADVAVQNTSRLLVFQQQAADSLDLLTTGLAGLSLAVGGAGIVALMYLSVKERTSEIGLRMAVGARERDILIQFLSEATTLSLAGWLAGFVAGGLIAIGITVATGWRVAVPLNAAVASFVMTLATGLLFGAVPARKASRLEPIEALLSR
jgi:putative ABC transport system permease protein